MDPFNKLPPELRLPIIIQLRSRRSISRLIQASPAMLEQYVTSKTYIMKKLLATDLDEDMMQDAMAIILFPWRNTSSNYSSLARTHLGSWAAHKLPNPIKENDGRLIDELGKLHSRLLLFIEDYLTKATAIFPPREYLCLPDLSPTRSELMFKGRPVNTRFDAGDLTEPERKRLLRAFLRYECFCKMHYTGIKHGDSWDEKPLYRYGPKEFHESECEAIQCVFTYVESLYGAMFAQCSDSWLPDIPASSLCSDATGLLRTGLLHPDNLYVNAMPTPPTCSSSVTMGL
ncbi:hypothetical protein ACJ41O_009305 [Fusarium nematophilum]